MKPLFVGLAALAGFVLLSSPKTKTSSPSEPTGASEASLTPPWTLIVQATTAGVKPKNISAVSTLLRVNQDPSIIPAEYWQAILTALKLYGSEAWGYDDYRAAISAAVSHAPDKRKAYDFLSKLLKPYL